MSRYYRDPTTGNETPIAGMRNLQDVKNLMLELCYPIGSMYMSTVNVSPATFLGGTWISHSGYVLRGATSSVTANQASNDGGADTVTLGNGNLPSHNHNNKSLSGEFDIHIQMPGVTDNDRISYSSGIVTRIGHQTVRAGTDQTFVHDTFQYDGATIDASHTHDSIGSGTAFNNLPKYKNVYIWERTA